jgi:anti-sigma factor RsiW
MTDHWTDRLSDYLDDDLSPSERGACEKHVASCADCRGTLAALRAVKERAGALLDPPAPNDLWAGIATRIGTAGSSSASRPRLFVLPRRRAYGIWPSVAAAAVTIAVTVGAVWFAVATRQAPATGAAVVAGDSSGVPLQLASFDAARVDGEIAQLQQALDRGRGRLDPATVVVLEKNLALIRRATEDAREALAKDPANRELQDYFSATVQSKLDLMRRATAMVGV